jgi:hypothetical protein
VDAHLTEDPVAGGELVPSHSDEDAPELHIDGTESGDAHTRFSGDALN